MTNEGAPMNTAAAHADDEEISLREIALQLWQGRWIIIALVVLCTAAMTVAAYSMTRVYRSTTVFVSASAGKSSGGGLSAALGQLGGLASLAGVSVGSGDTDTQEALAVLGSREFTERFITEKNLMPRLYAKIWDAAAGQWTVPEKARPTMSKAVAYFNEIRSVTQDKKTGLIAMSIDWSDRVEAATWANDLLKQANEAMRARAIAQSEASLGFLDKELKVATQLGTQEAINRLIEMQIKQRMLANVTAEYSFRVVDKAFPSDEDSPIKPKKRQMILAGALLGGFLGALWVLIAAALRRPSPR
jgi:uncharacterized protein involved in exopolysaccharide biosynthesis